MGSIVKGLMFKNTSQKLVSGSVPASFFDFKIKDIQGNLVDFAKYKGLKAILVVNVACQCGLTSSNYKLLTQMHNDLKDKGFELLAFPCNQFFNQQGGTPEQIVQFVKSKFNSKFTLFQKIEVNGPNTHPLYKYLRENSELYDKNEKQAKLIPWNFAKFLLNKNGEVVKFFNPSDQISEVRAKVQSLL